MEVSEPLWDRQHFDTLRAAYRTSKCWNDYAEELEWAYIDAPKMLSAINRKFLTLACGWLGVNTTVTLSTEYSTTGAKSDKLIALCKACGADCYLSGPTAKNYLDEKAFNDNGISVEWMQYSDWPKLTFLHGLFHGTDEG